MPESKKPKVQGQLTPEKTRLALEEHEVQVEFEPEQVRHVTSQGWQTARAFRKVPLLQTQLPEERERPVAQLVQLLGKTLH